MLREQRCWLWRLHILFNVLPAYTLFWHIRHSISRLAWFLRVEWCDAGFLIHCLRRGVWGLLTATGVREQRAWMASLRRLKRGSSGGFFTKAHCCVFRAGKHYLPALFMQCLRCDGGFLPARRWAGRRR